MEELLQELNYVLEGQGFNVYETVKDDFGDGEESYHLCFDNGPFTPVFTLFISISEDDNPEEEYTLSLYGEVETPHSLMDVIHEAIKVFNSKTKGLPIMVSNDGVCFTLETGDYFIENGDFEGVFDYVKDSINIIRCSWDELLGIIKNKAS